MSKTFWKIDLTVTEPLLGTAPLNVETYTDYVATKAPADVDPTDEILSIVEPDAVDDADVAKIEETVTGFHRVDGRPCWFDYPVLGFIKAACGHLRRDKDSLSSKMTAYLKIIEGQVFVYPRFFPIQVNRDYADLMRFWNQYVVLPSNGSDLPILKRPLRAKTPKGERVALARSEVCPAGSTMTFWIKVRSGVSEEQLREWLDFGEDSGIGQWRSGSFGRFTYTMVPAADGDWRGAEHSAAIAEQAPAG